MESLTQITYRIENEAGKASISTGSKRILGTQFSVRKISLLPNLKHSPGKCRRPVQPILSKCLHI